MNPGSGPQIRVVGIDPGTRVAGYGIVDVHKSGVIAVACGCWDLGKGHSLYDRLGKLSIEFERLVQAYTPTHLCLEEAFVARNSRSALLIGHARGAVLAKAHACGLVFHGMMPTEAKRRVTGNGHADKETVARCIKALLSLGDIGKLPFDATDGLALSYALAIDLQQNLRISEPRSPADKPHRSPAQLKSRAPKDKESRY
jgi:crossover junction endodeoxyribonuclease RuvC